MGFKIIQLSAEHFSVFLCFKLETISVLSPKLCEFS